MIFGVALAFPVSIFAMPPTTNLPKGKIKLTQAQVDKCVKIIPAYFNEFKNEKRKIQNINKGSTPSTSVETLLSNAKMLSKLKTFASQNGYSDFNDFIVSFSGVMMSYGYLKIKQSEKLIAAKLKQLPPQMKAMVQPQINALKKVKKQYAEKLTKETIKAVSAHMSEIDSVLASSNHTKKKRRHSKP